MLTGNLKSSRLTPAYSKQLDQIIYDSLHFIYKIKVFSNLFRLASLNQDWKYIYEKYLLP